MDGAQKMRRSARRLGGMLAVVSAISLFSSAPALAQSLGSITQAAAPAVEQATAPVTQAAAPVTQAAAPVTQAAAPVAQAAAPVVQAAAPVLQQATAPVAETVAPAVQAAAPVLASAAPVVKSATASTGALASTKVVAPAAPVLAGTTKTLDETTRPLTAPSSDPQEPAGTPSAVDQPPVSGSSTSAGLPPSNKAEVVQPRRERRQVASLGNAPPVVNAPLPGDAPTASSTGPNRGTNATPPRKPWLPGLPDGPAGPVFSAAPLPGGSASIFVAALVAALLLAAPGLSRRLRLDTAPWPLPIALPSLERPG
jgi:hypothetical protein